MYANELLDEASAREGSGFSEEVEQLKSAQLRYVGDDKEVVLER